MPSPSADPVAEALELAATIVDLVEEELPDGAYERGQEFFDSVLEKSRAIAETVEARGLVTAAQAAALRNMEAGVRRWLRD